MDYAVSQKFAPYLAPGESVRWTGRPRQGVALRASDALMIPFSIMWCGFAIFWEFSVVSMGAPFFFGLWGVPFVLVGLYIVFGRFMYDAWRRPRLNYALTDRRALILGGPTGGNLVSIDYRHLVELHFKPGAGGRGTILFGPDAGAFAFGRRAYAPRTPEFFSVEDADGAYKLIQQQRN